MMKRLLVCYLLSVNVLESVYSERVKCEKCIPKDKCEMFTDMNKGEQENWVNEHPCEMPEEGDSADLFGFATMAKGDLVCCPYSNIWGVENPSTPSETLISRSNQETAKIGNIFSQRNNDFDNGYSQDNLHKTQNSNLKRGDGYDVDYDKQRYRGGQNGRNRNNYERSSRNNNMNQPYIQGGNGNYLPVFGADGMPITNNGPNFNGYNYNQPNNRPIGNSFNQPNRPYGNNYNQPDYNPNAVSNRRQCSASVLPPDRESGCCGLDLSGERMFGSQSNFGNRPADRNSWANENRRFTRETPEELGIRLDDRIAGGKETELYQFPWTVLLKTTFDYGNRKGTFNCGGSLISSRYVLTAAHCVTELGARISNIDIYLAEYDKRTFPRDCINSPEGRKCIDNILTYAEGVYAHPNYDDAKLQSDIALIRLQENVPYTEYTRPICLPPINIDNPEYSNLRLAVAGWGRNGSVPSDLKQSTVINLVPQRECSRSYPSLTKQHICAAGRTGEDTCKGDSGGPLMMLYEGRYYVSGVVSGKRADAPCGTSVPSLYTNVFQFLPWIRQTIRN